MLRSAKRNSQFRLSINIILQTKDKIEGLCRLLDAEIDGKLIIFCRTKKGVDDLAIALGSRGYMAEGLHGDLSQTQRDRVMKEIP